MNRQLILIIVLIVWQSSVQANLLRNPGFEEIPGPGNGQGLMPSDWLDINVTPDTYSNDGSYGITPGDFGNFPATTAFDGLRWIAAWSQANEEFGQVLSAPLTPGANYTLTGWLLQAKRADLDNSGGYEVYLVADEFSSTGSGESLGILGSTADLDEWAPFSLDFVAPDNADVLPLIVFSSHAANPPNGSYAGLDNVSLSASSVPLPAPLLLLGSGLMLMLMKSRRR